jgi:hypothetical protein
MAVAALFSISRRRLRLNLGGKVVMSMSKSSRCVLADLVAVYGVLWVACRTGVRDFGF